MAGSPPTTTRRGFPRIGLTDNPDIPRDMNALADSIDAQIGSVTQGLLASRPATGKDGDIYIARNDTTMSPNGTAYWWDTSGAPTWRMLSAPVDPAVGVAGIRTLGAGPLQAASGSDARLSDARAPTAHATTHRVGGSDAISLLALSAIQVRDVGEANQIRAGRALLPADFTALGLSAPLGIWNLSDLTDSSGNGRSLTNKGAVPFTVGILGLASTAAQFAGSTAQALYIVDAAWQKITTGTWGCWFRTAKRGTAQTPMGKYGAPGNAGWLLEVQSTNVIQAVVSIDGTVPIISAGLSDVCDDRWHFAIATFDGQRLRLFVDGALETSTILTTSGPIFASSSPLNIGGARADGATNALEPLFGRADVAFLTGDVLSDDQVRNLYCASIPHALAVAPARVSVNVRRRRRGGPFLTTDFPSTPLRLHNFTAGALTDQGSGNVALVAVGGGTISDVAGMDGSAQGAKNFVGAHTGLGATDAGLPSGTATRSYGCWFKTTLLNPGNIMAWGTAGSGDARLVPSTTGLLVAVSAADQAVGTYVCDGFPHLGVVVEDNAAPDGVKRKLYVDGRLVGSSTVLNSITLLGANGFRVGAGSAGAGPFTGQIDAPFVIGVALTPEQVHAIYNVGSQALAPSPKSEGDHVEAFETTRLLAVFDTLEGCDQVDLLVSA
jgi:hypothetical protein